MLPLTVVRPQVRAVGYCRHAALVDSLHSRLAAMARLRVSIFLPVAVAQREDRQERVVRLPQPAHLILQ